MLYTFESDFVVGDRVAREQLGLSSSPFDAALIATLEAFGVSMPSRGHVAA